jgi:tripartite-type tricarboxylate transporter receptor subunit TctC
MKCSHLIRTLFLEALVGAALVLAQSAFAQGKSTKLIVGFPPGGPIDMVARMMSDQLGKELGHAVIVENKSGANAGIAAEFVAKAAPDGQTLFVTTAGAIVISPALYEKLPYDPVRDFAPISLITHTAEVMVANVNNPAKDVTEFIANAKKRKDGATMASSGVGSPPHLAMELLADVTKTNLRHVPYKGVAPAISDVIGGHVEALFIDVPVALSPIKGGKLKGLGMAAPKRHAMLPDVKTFEEMGIRGVDSDNWYAIYGPKGLSQADIERIAQAIRRTLEADGVRSRLLGAGLDPTPSTPAALAALQKSDTEKWARIIRLKNIKGE